MILEEGKERGEHRTTGWSANGTLNSTSAPVNKRNPRAITLVLAILTLVVLMLSAPESLRDDFDRGGLYLFSRSFIDDIPKRMSGPGRFRLITQPLIAAVLGSRSGFADARSGRPPFISAVLFKRDRRRELLKSGFNHLVNLLLMSILLDSVFQWMIFGSSHPGAAVVVGPVLVAAPYCFARALANRFMRLRNTP